MHIINKKAISFFTVLILLSSITILYISIATVDAQTQAGLKTYAFVEATPNPDGVGQQTVLRLGITYQLAAPMYGWEALTVTVTHPDGEKETLGPFRTDSTGVTYAIIVPIEVGNYTLQSHFPQQTNPAEVNSNGLVIAKGQVLLASDSEEVKVEVLAEPIHTYAITVTQTANGVIGPGTVTVNYGATPSFGVLPNAGYHIASITANGGVVAVTSPSSQSYQFSAVTAAGSLTATYAINTYAITVTQGANGVIAPATASVNYGGSQAFTITPSTGYSIASLTVDGSAVTVAESYTFTNVVTTHAITATYALTPTPTPVPTANPTSAPSLTPKPTAAPTPTVTPSPIPSSTTVAATTDTGATVELTISGNITSTQISGITIVTNQTATSTTVSFNVTGKSGTTGFGNMTIPKSTVRYGTTPTIYIDGKQASNQGYTQDTNNYYAWYTTHFSTPQVSIVFTAGSSIPEFPTALTIIFLITVTVALSVVVKRKLSEGYD
jgi:hypothetical protein